MDLQGLWSEAIMTAVNWTKNIVIRSLGVACIILITVILLLNYSYETPTFSKIYKHVTQHASRLITNFTHATDSVKTRLNETMIIYNPHEKTNFSVLISNPGICENCPDLRYMVYVHSGANRFKQRHVLRTTWLNTPFLEARGMRRVFLLGRHDGKDAKDVQKLIVSENELYGDILQGDYHDSYENISLKALMGMKWLSTHCAHAKLIVKFDDDLVVDFIKLLDILDKHFGEKKTFICQIFVGNLILRDPKSCMKWCLDPAVLPGKRVYPTHCSGPLYSMTPDLPELLYKASRDAPFVWIDDAYLTGVLPEIMKGVKHKQNPHTWDHIKSSEKILTEWGNYWKKLINASSREHNKTVMT